SVLHNAALAMMIWSSQVMEFESAQSNTTAKLPILKLVTKMSASVTAKEKTNKKNDVKARSLLLMALPNEHQLTFSQYNDAKTMFAAIETRFGGSRRFLPPEWNTHVVVWMNKAEIETMSIDDLYNNFKIVEQSVKKSVGASSGAQNLAFMTAPSTSSTNDVNTAKPAYEVSTVSPNVNIASHQDLEQIHKDDLEAMDLKWQLSLLSMRAKRECKAPRNKEGQFRNQDNTRKHENNEDTSSKAMFAIDGVGFSWSDMAEEEAQTNMALMAFSDFEVYNDKSCTKTCLKNYETLKKQCDDLIVKLNQTEFTVATYKRGLAKVEEQFVTYRKNEVLFSEEVAFLKREVACKDYEISVLKTEFEKVKQEKEGIEFKIEKFDNASKSLDKLLESQTTDRSKKGLGYNVVPPPHPLIYNRPTKLDLSYSDDSKENYDDSLVKEQVSNDTSSFVESPLNVDKETVFLVDKKIEFVKPKNHEKPVKKSVSYVNTAMRQYHTERPRAGNTARSYTEPVNVVTTKKGKPLMDDKGFVDSGCSRHMTGNIAYLSDFKEFDGGAHGGRFFGKGTLKTVGDEVVHKELGDRIERAATTASSLEAEQKSGNINKTQSMAILNGSSP
ncbi:hypothetical protein Tco_0902345, partial [Tanacetum coccineum]